MPSKSALKTTAPDTTSHLESVVDTSTLPGLYKSVKASILVNGEGSKTAQLTGSEALAQKLSRSVMIDLKEELATDAVEQIDEITVALHTKKGVENGATDFETLRSVTDDQIISSHTWVDVPPSVWQRDEIAAQQFGQLQTVSIASGGTGYVAGEVLTMLSPMNGKNGVSATLTVNTVDANGMITDISVTTGGERFGFPIGPDKVVGSTSDAKGLAISGSAAGTGLNLNIVAANAQHESAYLRIFTPIKPHTAAGAKLPVHIGYGLSQTGTKLLYPASVDAIYGDIAKEIMHFLPLNEGEYFSKDKKFPLFIQIGGNAMDYLHYPQLGPGGRVEHRIGPLPVDAIVVQILPQYAKEDIKSAQLHKVPTWCLGPQGVPQVDTSKVVLIGMSIGAAGINMYLQNAAKAGTNDANGKTAEGVTHAVVMAPSLMRMMVPTYGTIPNPRYGNITTPTYLIAMDKDEYLNNDNRKYMGTIAASHSGVRVTLIEAPNPFPDDNLGWKKIFEKFNIIRNNFDATRHNLGGLWSMFSFSEVQQLLGVYWKTTAFSAPEGGEAAAEWDPSDTTLNQPFIDMYEFLGLV